MTPEQWDAYAAKFGRAKAIEMLGPRPEAPVSVDPTSEIAAEPVAESARPRAGVLDYLQRLGQGVTFGGGDELAGLAARVPGGLTPEEATAASRRATARARERTGLPGAVVEGAGALATGMLLPSLGIRAAAAQTGGGLVPALTGAGIGAAEGAAYGALSAEPGSRLQGAALPAAFGAGFGLTAPVAGHVLSHGAGRAQRLIQALGAKAGLKNNILGVRQRANTAVSQARARHFTPLDDLGEISNPRLDRWFEARGLEVKPRTVREMQEVVSNYTRRSGADNVAGKELKRIMGEEIPGFVEANRAYGQAIRPQQAIRQGYKAANKPAADIVEEQAATFGRNLDPTPFNAFREGQAHRVAHRLLSRGDQGSVTALKQMERTGQLRTLFSEDRSYEAFRRILNTEQSAVVLAGHLRRLAPYLAWGLGAAAGFEGLRRLSGP